MSGHLSVSTPALTHGCAEFVLLLADRFYPPHRHLEADAELHILRGTGEALLNACSPSPFWSALRG